ncbi:alkaline phosphatase 4-like isoform X2 [Venturia canescens]|nr:alkaline phosphatase 4-like isoform X2 [Venturia canescens]
MANRKIGIYLTTALLVTSCGISSLEGLERGSKQFEDASFWLKSGQENLERILAMRKNERRAKNIIIFIGDGMGMASITTGRIFTGQAMGQTGEEYKLAFETFPNSAFSKTYNVDKQVPDSAGTATAMFTGVKSRYKVIGFDGKVNYDDCDKVLNEASKISSVANWAQATGMDTGFVTTTRITHATPAALYAHVNNRDWECDSAIPLAHRDCIKDIARQLVEDAPGNRFKVIMGGGGQNMGVPMNGPVDSESCTRRDRKNLAAFWEKNNPKGKFVNTSADLMSLDIGKTESILGIFSQSHMPYHALRTSETPTLANMTMQAIRLLKKYDKGFLLMVESGKIDIAHHQNYAKLALREVTALEEAVKAALSQVDTKETLIIVTADHSHAFTMNGYPSRGNDILGFANDLYVPGRKPYETLTYANGPGFFHHRNNASTNINETWIPVENETDRADPFYRSLATFYLKDETHGGEDVGVYAIGPWSHLFRGTFEQNYIAHVIAYAGCFKDWPSHCNSPYNRYFYELTNSSGTNYSVFSLYLSLLAAAGVASSIALIANSRLT